MKKSLSQRIAGFLGIANCLLLIPTSLIEIGVLIASLISLVHFQFAELSFCVVITIIYCIGTLLLYGYYKHQRGETNKTSAFFLWVGTIGFNAIPFFWMLFTWAGNNFTLRDKTSEFWFYNILGCYMSVILLATMALINDLRREFD
jgi:hypothetical protein